MKLQGEAISYIEGRVGRNKAYRQDTMQAAHLSMPDLIGIHDSGLVIPHPPL